MALDIDNAFVEQFEREVHMAYQRKGSKLRSMVRTKSGITGSKTTFQKAGKGNASQKSRHGNVTPMNIDHTKVSCNLEDWYAPEYIDKLDELKINHDERMVVTDNASYALGRKTDEMLVAAMETSSNAENVTEGGTDGMTEAKVKIVTKAFGDNDIPEDDRYFAVAPGAWNDMLAINAFANADYIGSDDLPYRGGMVARKWQGFTFFTFSGLSIAASKRTNIAFHRTAVGHAIGSEIQTDVSWVGEKVAWLFNSMMSMGSCLIDEDGVILVETHEA